MVKMIRMKYIDFLGSYTRIIVFADYILYVLKRSTNNVEIYTYLFVIVPCKIPSNFLKI